MKRFRYISHATHDPIFVKRQVESLIKNLTVELLAAPASWRLILKIDKTKQKFDLLLVSGGSGNRSPAGRSQSPVLAAGRASPGVIAASGQFCCPDCDSR